MQIEELKKFNREILENYFLEKNSQNVVMPGFFNGDIILFVGQNPGELKENCDGDMKYIEAYNNRDVEAMNIYYEEALKSNLGVMGIFINDIFGEDWKNISFTNVVKTPFKENDFCIDNKEFHFNILKKQIELLSPKIIVAIGSIADTSLREIGITPTITTMHPSYMKKNGIYNSMKDVYSKQLEDLCFKYFITNCDTIYNDVYIKYLYKNEKKLKIIKNYNFHFYVEDENGEYLSYDGRRANKLYFNTFKFSNYKERIEWFKNNKKRLFESDVDFNIKYLINENCMFTTNQNIAYLDIETNLSLDVINVTEPIISISITDNKDKKVCFTWKEDLEENIIEKENNTYVHTFNNEIAMIKSFFSYIKNESYDIIATWNGATFDMPYLLNRALKLNININDISPYGKTYFYIGESRENCRFKIYGINCVDLMQVYKKATYDKRPPSYSLNSVAKHLQCGEKIDVDNVRNLWKDNINKLIEYNINDCIMLKNIDEKSHLIDLLKTLQQLSLCPIDLAIWNKNVCDCYILRSYKDKFIFPDIQDNKKENYEGALTGKLVFDENGKAKSISPKAGLFKNVAVPDFSSMYPSLIRTFNISSETVDENGDIEIDGVKFNSKKPGILPQLYDKVLIERKKYERLRDSFQRDSMEWYIYSNFQAMIKQIGNSLYGLNGFPGFRLFNPKVAKTITYLGRELISYSYKKIEELGYTPIYCDTDSTFTLLGDNLTVDEVIEEAKKLENKINYTYDEFVKKFGITKHYLKVDVEKIFSKIIFTGVKKKYIGRLCYKKGEKTNEIFGRGIELIKRDTPVAFRKFLKEVVRKLLDDEDDIKIYIENFKSELEKNYNLNELAISKQISKHLEDYDKTMPQHIKAVIYSNKNFGYNFMKSDTARIYYVIGPIDVIALDEDATSLPKGFTIDFDRYFKNFVYKKLEMFNAIKDLSNQTKLNLYFS